MRFKKSSILLILVCLLSACSMPSPNQMTPSPTHLPLETPITLNTPSPMPTHSPTPTFSTAGKDGFFALLMGDYEEAIARFQSTAAQATNPAILAETNLGIGQAYYQMENYAPALDHLRAASESSNGALAARANYFLGRVYTNLERYQEAVAVYEAYLALRPGVIDTHVLALEGDLHILLGDQNEAISSYQAAYLAAPETQNTEGLAIKIARAYDQLGDLETALSLYKDIYNTTASEYTKAQMDLLIGQIYLALEQPQEAYLYFQDAVNNYPYAYDAYTALLILLENDIQVNEYQRGLVNYYLGQYALAVEAFDRYMVNSPEAPHDGALYFKALSLRGIGATLAVPQYEIAITLWQTITENYPTSSFFIDAWEQIEFTQWAYLDTPTAAAETATTFVARYPENPEAPNFLFRAGRSYERAGLLAEAAAAWERIPNEYPNSEETFRSIYFAGISHFRLGDLETAQQTFDRALVLSALSAETAAAHLWIGKCQEARGDLPAALDSWKAAQTADPFGYYSIRAEDLLLGREIFADPLAFSLQPDLTPFRPEAEAWLRETHNLPPAVNLESPGALAGDSRFQRGMEFWSLGEYELGKKEFESLRQAVEGDPAQTFRLIEALVDIGLYRSALIASTNLLKPAGLEGAAALEAPEYFTRIRFGAYFLDWLLPIAESEGFSPLLLLSIIRQESTYEGFIQSSAGARGLMQIIPSTGAQLANELGWPEEYTVADLNRPFVSLRLGTVYLDRQRQLFDGDLYAMLAAYNGGPGNTLVWHDLAPDDPDLFLEVVRIEETRNYIRLITEIHYIYRWLYGVPESTTP